MADAEDKAKAEKLAAARKRVEQLKKKKKTSTKREDQADGPPPESSKTPEPSEGPSNLPEPSDEAQLKTDEGEESNTAEEPNSGLNIATRQRQPSLSEQSKIRSSSFRQASGGPLSPNPFSPEGDTAQDIYRKQAMRIEELEKDNKRLSKELSDSEKRWKKAEEELDDMREAGGDSTKDKNAANLESSEDEEKLQHEIASLKRQITQLQAQTARTSRHGSSPSVSAHPPANYEAELASKSATIESMEIEISNLKAHIERMSKGDSEKEQISALEEKLRRSEKSAAVAQRELGDLKKNLDRTTEKAVKEGSERISAETKLRTLERESEEAKTLSTELQKKVDSLEKKIATLGTLHKEHDSRLQREKKEREKAEREGGELRARQAIIETENLRLKAEHERSRKRDALGTDDDAVDELENEERLRLEKQVRDLEEEVHELRRGVWRERRKELEGGESPSATSPGARFTDVDLGGGMSPNRRRSMMQGGKSGGGLGDFITSGFNAITGANVHPAAHGADDALLEDDDDLLDFDEDAFRLAQQEEAKNRIERVKEVKRGLKNWEGWRLDLVENRTGGGEGVGAIFEV